MLLLSVNNHATAAFLPQNPSFPVGPCIEWATDSELFCKKERKKIHYEISKLNWHKLKQKKAFVREAFLFPVLKDRLTLCRYRGFFGSDNGEKHLVTLLCNCCWETLKIWEEKKIPTCFSSVRLLPHSPCLGISLEFGQKQKRRVF